MSLAVGFADVQVPNLEYTERIEAENGLTVDTLLRIDGYLKNNEGAFE